ASSRHIRQQRLPEVMKRLWGGHFWSPSYFVVSCGGAPLDVVKSYVESQQDADTKKRKAAAQSLKMKRKSYPQAEVWGLRILDG
ncbi:transposase, partial [Loktanella sp. DJP18]|uniref:transposase n=1 Tax=Loktanella sp. DJP18 TaxID=3409788 RepID=UPI003BB5A963